MANETNFRIIFTVLLFYTVLTIVSISLSRYIPSLLDGKLTTLNYDDDNTEPTAWGTFKTMWKMISFQATSDVPRWMFISLSIIPFILTFALTSWFLGR